jgi:hypothetical protein
MVLEFLVALGAISGGIALATDIIRFPREWLQGTPFSDYTIPGAGLAILVGGSALCAALSVFIRRKWATFLPVMAGFLMAAYEVVHVELFDHLPWFYAGFFLLGLAAFSLATYLWLAEYPDRSSSTRQHSPL